MTTESLYILAYVVTFLVLPLLLWFLRKIIIESNKDYENAKKAEELIAIYKNSLDSNAEWYKVKFRLEDSLLIKDLWKLNKWKPHIDVYGILVLDGDKIIFIQDQCASINKQYEQEYLNCRHKWFGFKLNMGLEHWFILELQNNKIYFSSVGQISTRNLYEKINENRK